jgi:hypothetical protein
MKVKLILHLPVTDLQTSSTQSHAPCRCLADTLQIIHKATEQCCHPPSEDSIGPACFMSLRCSKVYWWRESRQPVKQKNGCTRQSCQAGCLKGNTHRQEENAEREKGEAEAMRGQDKTTISTQTTQSYKKTPGLSPPANYTDRVTAAFRRS